MKLVHNFDEPINRVNTDSFKWDYEGEDGKYIPLGVADTDFKAPQPVIDAVKAKAEFGVYAYGALPQKRFAEAITGWYKRRYDLDVDPEAVRHSQGLMTGALWMILNAYTRPGDKILLQAPVYNTFSVVIKGAGRFVESNDLVLKDGHYEIDFDDLDRKTSDPRVRILLVCNPHNPVGRVWSKEELSRMYEICRKNDTLIVSDEIHGDIVYGTHKHIPYFSISEEIKNHVVVMGSPSKTFNLACFYSAYVVIHNKALRDQYNVVYDNYHFDYNYLGIEALITSYNDCEYYVEQQNEYFLKNINLVKEFVAREMPDVKIIEPEGTYLLWIDFRAWNMEQGALMNLFKAEGVKLNSGSNYGTPGLGFIRLNVATQTAVLEKALRLMKQANDKRLGK
ncbi:MAG: pyridoxal phosphate-dependent aminotransferase [Lachnospiraceae bacterium]|nr:pyridoxal phosphate-dependent aminotransferase [Lachnospiraceae bacterium]